MKGGFYGLRGKQISLIALICGTIVFWAWDKTSLLANFLPPQSPLLNSSPEIILGLPVTGSIYSKPDVHRKEDIANTGQEGEGISEQEKRSSDNSAAENIPDKSDVEETIPHIEQKGVRSNFSEAHNTPQQDFNGETRIEQVDKPLDSGKPTDTETTTTNEIEKEESLTIDLKEKKENLSGSSEEQNNPKLGLNGEPGIEPLEKTPDSGTQIDSKTTALYETERYKNSTVDLVVKKPVHLEEKKVCNYAKGKWVEDSKRPLYSGFGCKQWLSGMWACRLTQRTDFSYEKFRWSPHNCEMPEFEGSSFLKRMKDKTIAIIGDSLGRQQFQSLMCMATGGKQRSDVLDIGREYGLVKAHGATRPDGWAYRFPTTNTTVLYYWSASLSDLEPIDITNPATDWAMHLDRPPAFLRIYLHRFDVLVLNTGHHWNRGKLRANRWVMYVGGVPNTNRKIAEIGGAKNFTVYSVVKWLDSQLPKHPKLKAFFRTISPRHFFHGDWDSGGSCDNVTPLAGGKEVLQEKSSDPVASGAVKGTRVKLLDISAPSELRDEGHISRYSIKATPGVQDCLHWCLPGVPDSWNEVLFAQV